MDERNPAMLIFLGKNWLGQSDKQDVKLTGSEINPIQINNSYDLSALSEQELLNLRELLLKAKSNEELTHDSGDR